VGCLAPVHAEDTVPEDTVPGTRSKDTVSVCSSVPGTRSDPLPTGIEKKYATFVPICR